MGQNDEQREKCTWKKISIRIERIETVIAAICLITSTLLIFLAAVVRSFSQPINWSLDISLFLFAWAVFFSADVAYRDDKLVNLDFVLEIIPDRLTRIFQILIYLIIFTFLVALVYYGAILVYKTRARAFQGIPNFSYSWITISLPIGAMLLVRSTIEKLIFILRDRKEETDDA